MFNLFIYFDSFKTENINKVESEIKRTFIETYKKTDDDFLREATKQ